MFKYLFAAIISLLIFVSCKQDTVEQVDSGQLFVSLRMEVHVADSVYHLYSRPFIEVHLYTYKITGDGIIKDESYSDTTTCQNGWAVKEVEFILSDEDEIIYLGASTKDVGKNKYNFAEVSYTELMNLAQDRDSIRFIKTFTIYE